MIRGEWLVKKMAGKMKRSRKIKRKQSSDENKNKSNQSSNENKKDAGASEGKLNYNKLRNNVGGTLKNRDLAMLKWNNQKKINQPRVGGDAENEGNPAHKILDRLVETKERKDRKKKIMGMI